MHINEELLRNISFGHRVAEEEVSELSSYFVRTAYWDEIFNGKVDVVYGAKGSGKSALYTSLVSHEDALFDRGILLVAAENPRGDTAFRGLVNEPPMSELQLKGLWKIYLLAVAARKLQEFDVENKHTKIVFDALITAGVMETDSALARVVKLCSGYVRKIIPSRMDMTGSIDPVTGTPILSGSIVFSDTSPEQKNAGIWSIDSLFSLLQQGLEVAKIKLWLVLDRLDVAFADSEELEVNALRALFMTYLDIKAYPDVIPKIFLRTDIWQKLTADGFREASHITKTVTIDWADSDLLNLIFLRIVSNKQIVEHYKINVTELSQDFEKQKQFFYRVFPSQIDSGPNKPSTFDWMRTRTRDGSKLTAPRELIHLLTVSKTEEIKRLGRGESPPVDQNIFSAAAIKVALNEVSLTRLNQTLYAEYPSAKPFIEMLRKEKAEQTLITLKSVWKADDEQQVQSNANFLVEIGFFENRGDKDAMRFWTPFLYRPALDLVQGAAD
jgi:hypothetical protein